MAKEALPIDITDFPDLVRLAEEVRASNQPRVLRRDSEDLAVLMPVGQTTATDDADFLHAPHDIWANYDPAKVLLGLKQAAGALKGVDRDELLKDIHEAREQDSTGRPA